MKKNPLLLDNQLCFSLYTASRMLIQAYQPLLEPLGLTYLQYLTMLVLWEHDKVSVSQLGERLLLDSGTLSPLLKKLEQKNLVVRKRAVSDERTVVVTLTDKGRKLRSAAENIPSELRCQTKMTDQNLLGLKSAAQNLVADLNSPM